MTFMCCKPFRSDRVTLKHRPFPRATAVFWLNPGWLVGPEYLDLQAKLEELQVKHIEQRK